MKVGSYSTGSNKEVSRQLSIPDIAEVVPRLWPYAPLRQHQSFVSFEKTALQCIVPVQVQDQRK